MVHSQRIDLYSMYIYTHIITYIYILCHVSGMPKWGTFQEHLKTRLRRMWFFHIFSSAMAQWHRHRLGHLFKCDQFYDLLSGCPSSQSFWRNATTGPFGGEKCAQGATELSGADRFWLLDEILGVSDLFWICFCISEKGRLRFWMIRN